MSVTKSSSTTSDDIESPCVGERAGDGKEESSSAGDTVRERVLKEVGLTSSTFIGPAFPPPATTAKSDIEDTLSEFYKELEEIDTPDGATEIPESQDAGFVPPPVPPNTYISKETPVIASTYAETDGFLKSSAHKQQSRPHWYQNEPYYPRRPRPGVQDQSFGMRPPIQNEWQYPPIQTRPQAPRFQRPPPHCLPPPSTFPHPRNPPPHIDQSWSGSGNTNQYREEPHFQTYSHFPPPDVCSRPSQGPYGDSPYHLDRDDRGGSYDPYSDLGHLNSRWPSERREEWCQFDEDCDWRQKCDSQKEPWEHHRQPPVNNNTNHSPLVLILMRGLPGSGKSSLARELLSTGPSGLILSTDDYFDHRNGYCYEPGLLGAAHEWNQRRANDAMRDGRSPIIIDNTNLQAWEMKPYVKMALERRYKVDFCEPETSWKFDPYELEKRNKHGVPKEKIAQMMDRFSFPVSIDIIMSSQEPHHVEQRHQPEQPHRMRSNPDFR